MGRHGGGSRGGGSSRSSSGGSRGGGGSGARTSSKPFIGGYNRSYYDRKGRLHTCYTSNKNFGTKSGWTPGLIAVLVFLTCHMLLMSVGTLYGFIDFGGKVSGDKSRIFIEDRANLLTATEEQKVLNLFGEVYEATGMPITLYTDDFSWKKYYLSLEFYSEELYYKMGMEEDAMVILFTADNVNGFDDWEYDIYCGDDTTKCFSDAEFDTLLENMQKSMAGQNLADALEYAWRSVMDDIGKMNINWAVIPSMSFIVIFYSIFYISILSGTVKSNAAYKYFKEHPDKLSMMPITVIYSACPNCGASNTEGGEICQYCGSLLKTQDGNKQYVNPNDIGN